MAQTFAQLVKGISATNAPANSLTIDSSGRVGLGTSSPGTNFELRGSGVSIAGINTHALISDSTTAASGVGGNILFEGNYTSGGARAVYAGIAGTKENGTDSDYAGNLKFYTRANGSLPALAMTITSSQRVGIGTTSPSGRLTIENDAALNELEFTGSNYTNIYSSTTQGFDIGISNASSAGPLRFLTANAERARIDSSGRLLVGTSSESGNALLAVRGNTTTATGAGALDIGLGTTRPGAAGTPIAYLRFTSTSNTVSNYAYASIYAETDGTSSSDSDIPGRLVFGTTADGAGFPTERMRITQAGNTFVNYSSSSTIESEVFGVQGTSTLMGRFTNNTNTSGYHGIRTSIGSNGNNTSTYHFSGNTSGVNNWYLWGNGTTTYSSDERLKKNIETTRDGYLEDIKQLRVVKYNWKNHEDGTPKELGLIAQEVAQVFPGLVQDDVSPVSDEDPTLYKQLKGSVLPVILLKALQEAVDKIETLEAKVAALEAS
jgi:hypothetical protein